MPIILPSQPVKQRAVNPGKLLIYGPRKTGKTPWLSSLPGLLLIDTEKGTSYLKESLSIQVNSLPEFDEIAPAIVAKAKADMAAKGEKTATFPYKFIGLDTITSLEEMVERQATLEYNKEMKAKDKDFVPVESIEELAYGAGYGKIRRGVIKSINNLASVCKYLIIVAHLKETELDKAGRTVLSSDISLQGKLKDIICSRVDAIGYVFWDEKEMKISFTSLNKGGSRINHLANTILPCDWSKIYLDEGLPSVPWVAGMKG